MASITYRGPHQYQAQIRRKGYPTQTRTFESKSEAQDWAKEAEAEMTLGTFVDRSELERTTFLELLDRYAREETPKKRGRETELVRIRALMKHPLAARRLSMLRGMDFAKYRDDRLKTCCAETVRRELVIISAVFTKARELWELPLGNPLAGVEWPAKGRHRERRLRGDEEVRLLAAANESRGAALPICIILAIETGMRAGEIGPLRREQIDFAGGVIRLGLTKNGDSRRVPLTARAETALRSVSWQPDGRLTTFYDSRGLSKAFRLACMRAGINGLCFHDLRHEAASRLAPRMPTGTLAKILGWKTLQMAMRYYNPTDEELVAAVRKPAPAANVSEEPFDITKRAPS
ncbi:site-specific integrase [Ralstonia solanacearum]|nr:site-specific integrase [Ralstonia solanacearum]